MPRRIGPTACQLAASRARPASSRRYGPALPGSCLLARPRSRPCRRQTAGPCSRAKAGSFPSRTLRASLHVTNPPCAGGVMLQSPGSNGAPWERDLRDAREPSSSGHLLDDGLTLPEPPDPVDNTLHVLAIRLHQRLPRLDQRGRVGARGTVERMDRRCQKVGAPLRIRQGRIFECRHGILEVVRVARRLDTK